MRIGNVELRDISGGGGFLGVSFAGDLLRILQVCDGIENRLVCKLRRKLTHAGIPKQGELLQPDWSKESHAEILWVLLFRNSSRISTTRDFNSAVNFA